MGASPINLESVCVYCGSSDDADPDFMEGARTIGRSLAGAGVRLVYGGGGVGLMGACAMAAHEAGGAVLGVIPQFLLGKERALESVEHIVVTSMHERKSILLEKSDGFIVMPGGIGTLEEIVELLSWRRLDLHKKPIAFYNPKGFWDPFFALMQHTVDQKLTPPEFMDCWISVDRAEEVAAALLALTIPGPDIMPGAVRLT